MKCVVKFQTKSKSHIGADMFFQTLKRHKQTHVGKITRINGLNVTFEVLPGKEAFVKSFFKRNNLKDYKILPDHNHPLTNIFQ